MKGGSITITEVSENDNGIYMYVKVLMKANILKPKLDYQLAVSEKSEV